MSSVRVCRRRGPSSVPWTETTTPGARTAPGGSRALGGTALVTTQTSTVGT